MFEEVCQTDRPYIDWVFREEKSGELSPNLAALVAYVGVHVELFGNNSGTFWSATGAQMHSG